MRLPKLPAAIACLAVIAAGTIVAAAPAAGAGVVDAQCEGITTIQYSPGLTGTTQTVTITAANSYPTCLSLADLTISSAEGTVQPLTGPDDCVPLITSPITVTETWSNGQTSTMGLSVIDISTEVSAEVLTATGSVTSGEFAGDTVVNVITIELTDLGGCDNPGGLTELSGVSTLTLTSE
ncbi:MAG TPA: hypothetical protein VH637_08435 [Streptosporangiaceae bacterium]|jgi:hypothetical protein